MAKIEKAAPAGKARPQAPQARQGTTVTTQNGQNFLANVPDEWVFYNSDGRIMRNMQEFKAALDSMTDETYARHANSQKNDFCNWVRDVIKDAQLAIDLAKAQDRQRAAAIVSQRVAFLKAR